MPELSSIIAASLPATKLLYSRKDAAYSLSISIRALDYAISNKQLKPRILGSRVMIPAAELLRFASEDQPDLTASPSVAVN